MSSVAFPVLFLALRSAQLYQGTTGENTRYVVMHEHIITPSPGDSLTGEEEEQDEGEREGEGGREREKRGRGRERWRGRGRERESAGEVREGEETSWYPLSSDLRGKLLSHVRCLPQRQQLLEAHAAHARARLRLQSPAREMGRDVVLHRTGRSGAIPWSSVRGGKPRKLGRSHPEEPVRKIMAKQRVDFPAALGTTRGKSWISRQAYHRSPS